MNERIFRFFVFSLVGVLALGLGGCAGRQRGPAISLKWPEPPETTRIVFERVWVGESDFQSSGTVRSLLNLIGVREPAGWQMRQPIALAVTPSGDRLYVADYGQRLVGVFDFTKREVRLIGTEQPLGLPIGVALSPNGELVVSDQQRRRLLFFDGEGNFKRAVSIKEVERPTGLAIDKKRGRIYVVDGSSRDSMNHVVRVYDLDGRYLMQIGKGRGQRDGYLFFPTYVAVDEEGRIYVADSMNSRVSCFDPEGEFIRTYGERGDSPGTFNKPKGIAFDTFGNMYVVDSAWSAVQIWNKQGDVLLSFGGRSRLPGLFQNPTAIAIDGNNRIYVADTFNFRVNVYRLVNTTPEDSLKPPPSNDSGGTSAKESATQ